LLASSHFLAVKSRQYDKNEYVSRGDLQFHSIRAEEQHVYPSLFRHPY